MHTLGWGLQLRLPPVKMNESRVKCKLLTPPVWLFAIPWISPWTFPSQNPGVGSLFLLQGIFPTQGSNPGLPHYRRILYQLSHKGSPNHCKDHCKKKKRKCVKRSLLLHQQLWKSCTFCEIAFNFLRKAAFMWMHISRIWKNSTICGAGIETQM